MNDRATPPAPRSATPEDGHPTRSGVPRRTFVTAAATIAWAAPSVTSAGAVLATVGSPAPTNPGASSRAGYTFTIQKVRDADGHWMPGNPVLTVRNDSVGDAEITAWRLTIGDTSNEFHAGPLHQDVYADWSTPGIALERHSPVLGGRSDLLAYVFTAFPPGAQHATMVDLDEDGHDTSAPPFYEVLFNNGSLPNARVTVSFSNGTELSQTLTDGGSHPYTQTFTQLAGD